MYTQNINQVYAKRPQYNSKYSISQNNRQNSVSFGKRIEDEISVNISGKTIPINYFIPKIQGKIIDAIKLQCKISSFILKTFPEGINNAEPEKIFNAFGIKTQKDENGLLTIDYYGQPSEDFTWNHIGVDENRLLYSVKNINNDADFRESKISSLGNIEYIGGNIDLLGQELEDIEKLKYIDGSACFAHCKINSLKNLKSIKHNAWFKNAKIGDLGNLESIGFFADFTNSKIENLGNLKSIGNDNDDHACIAHFDGAKIKDLGTLKFPKKNKLVIVNKNTSKNIIEYLKQQKCKIIYL